MGLSAVRLASNCSALKRSCATSTLPLDRRFQAAAKSLVGVLAVFATLESVAGFCAGCFAFNYLMRWGVIPESVCRECLAVRPQPG